LRAQEAHLCNEEKKNAEDHKFAPFLTLSHLSGYFHFFSWPQHILTNGRTINITRLINTDQSQPLFGFGPDRKKRKKQKQKLQHIEGADKA
jgi:hypothetical protein